MMRVFRDLEIRRLVAALLLVPLLVYSFFAVHTMPRFTDRGMEIVICSADGLGAVSPGDRDDPDGAPPASCAWAMQIHAAALPDAAPAAAILALTRSETASFETAILRKAKVNAGRHARAPPLSV
ncbi:DUF2946 family protein [Hoeflea sp.]|uniref:DUF2946 family protein n=1 Tax=Hoeflea sp. TaxID=1940281 RepID=UPI0019946042|nr:DUF2946 family protein [Hoeflea sp.]MBC7284893.1 hypothetical protein [Hoeflea sp.]